MDEVGDVDGLNAPEGLEGDAGEEEAHGCAYHGIAQGAGGCSSYEDAVPQEGEATDHRHGYEPRQEGMGVGYDAGIRGHEPYCTLARQGIEEGEGYADNQRPEEEDAHGSTQAVRVACADETPCQGLGSIGKAVDKIAEEHEQLHHDGADGKRPVAIFRRERREAHIHHHEAEGADEEVAVEDKQPADLLPAKSGREKLKIEGCDKARAEWSWLRFCRA